jgi:hypothetical protein
MDDFDDELDEFNIASWLALQRQVCEIVLLLKFRSLWHLHFVSALLVCAIANTSATRPSHILHLAWHVHAKTFLAEAQPQFDDLLPLSYEEANCAR